MLRSLRARLILSFLLGLALARAPENLQLQDSAGAVVADSSPGRGPGGPGGPDDGSPGPQDPTPDGGPGPGPDGGGGGRPQGGAAPIEQPLFAQAEGQGTLAVAPAEQPPVATEEAAGGDGAGREVTRTIPVFADGQQVATLVVLSQEEAATPGGEIGERFLDRVRLAPLGGGGAALGHALFLARRP